MQTTFTTFPVTDETDDEFNLATSSVEDDTELPESSILEEEPPVPEPETPAPPPVTGKRFESRKAEEEQVERDALEDERRNRLPAIQAPNSSGIGSTVPL